MEKGTYGISKILDIMEDCQAEPKSGKLNWPVSEQLNVPIAKRAKFMGPGKKSHMHLLSTASQIFVMNRKTNGRFNIFFNLLFRWSQHKATYG